MWARRDFGNDGTEIRPGYFNRVDGATRIGRVGTARAGKIGIIAAVSREFSMQRAVEST
jgi:hypothetical protein